MKNIDYKLLAKSILIPLVLGGIVGLLTSSFNTYQEIIQPEFAPPAIIFPIVWSILYILMGISYYLIITSNKNSEAAQKVYKIQLFINLIWPIIFFIGKAYFISFVWLLLLIYFVLQMILEFFKVRKSAALLQLPYFAWVVFAGILNLWIYFLNR